MSTTYKIIGADGRPYGPVAAEQIRRWIAESRVESRTPVLTEGGKDWTFVGLLPEFADCFAGAAPPTIAPPPAPPRVNPYAIAGLVCSLLAWVCCCGFPPFNLLGLIFSLIGLSQINQRSELYEGRGLAIAGLVLPIVSLLVSLGMLVWSLAFHPPAIQWRFQTF